MVNIFFIDVTHQVWKISHFSFKIYFLTRMKMHVRVIFKARFSLSSMLSRYAVVSFAQALPLTKTFFS